MSPDYKGTLLDRMNFVKPLIFLLLTVPCYTQAQQHSKQTVISSDHIRINHIGPEDKPFPSLVITVKDLELQMNEWEILTDRKVFAIALKTLQESPLTNSSLMSDPEFGTFSITSLIAGTRVDYFLSKRDNAIRFFNDLKTKIENERGGDKLVGQIIHLLTRIDDPNSR